MRTLDYLCSHMSDDQKREWKHAVGRVINAMVAAERKACAAVALKKGSKRIAEAIRARGQEAKPTTD